MEVIAFVSPRQTRDCALTANVHIGELNRQIISPFMRSAVSAPAVDELRDVHSESAFGIRTV